jgi:hypothetical protein
MPGSKLSARLAPLLLGCAPIAPAQPQAAAPRPVVLHAARLLDIESGKILSPGEVLVRGEL